VSSRRSSGARRRAAALAEAWAGVRRVAEQPRIGVFGLLGSGNIGNDASLESVLAYLARDHPDAVVDAMCMGPESVRARYGIAAIPLLWCTRYDQRLPRPAALAVKAIGKGVDAFRTASWVRRHDAVIVPGMGVLEASLPLRPWGVPYAMLLLCASGRVFSTRVALVSVGANQINQRATRWLFDSAARLAFYRSYRDEQSRQAMTLRGVDTSADLVFPDLVFALPTPQYQPGDPRMVGVGVMTYLGTNDDRARAGDIHSAYVRTFSAFVRWLVDGGRQVRLLVGDSSDETTVREILADLHEQRPDLGDGQVVAAPASTFDELTAAMAPVGTVVATRFHNLICALRLGKPVVSLGYANKNVELMTGMGLGEYCQSANSLDLDLLIEQFTAVDRDRERLSETIAHRGAAYARRLDEQFALLSTLLVPGREAADPDVGVGGAGAESMTEQVREGSWP
jgi:polysaccharide pyruvyl transferase WcaK-like protein